MNHIEEPLLAEEKEPKEELDEEGEPPAEEEAEE